MSESLHFKPLVLVLVAFATIQSPQSKKISAISSSINGPTDMALDNNGHLFVIEGEEDKVRRIDLRDGVISAVAGSGRSLKGDCVHRDDIQATKACLHYPTLEVGESTARSIHSGSPNGFSHSPHIEE